MSANLNLVNVQRLLKNERNQRFMTFEDVAKGVGLSTSYIYRMEKGERKNPSHDVISKLIIFFGLTEEEVNSYIDDPSNKKKNFDEDIMQFISTMNCNDFTQVNELLNRIKDYQQRISNHQMKVNRIAVDVK